MNKLLIYCFIAIMLLGLVGCGKTFDVQGNGGSGDSETVQGDGGSGDSETVQGDGGSGDNGSAPGELGETADEMDIVHEEKSHFYLMNINGDCVEVYNDGGVHTRAVMLDNGVELPEVEEGHFKKITAEVEEYYGGENGYSGDKFVKKITAAEDADYSEVFEALDIQDASANDFSAKEMLKFQDMNDNYLLVANGEEIKVYRDGVPFTVIAMDEVRGMDYPAPFFEALENYKETKATEEASEKNASAGDAVEYVEVDGYKQITPETAQKMMETETGYVIVDVRHDDEYYDGHIPDAVLITNEYIEDEPIPELPDKDQLILVYCRSGRRSKDAARKLAAIGYTNVYEFGGIIDWPGPITSE